MRLIVVHNHYRPGGVRRVIELATLQLARGLHTPPTEVVLAGGEPPESEWLLRFAQALAPVPATYLREPGLNYFAEQKIPPAEISARLKSFFSQLLPLNAPSTLVWAHNQGLGRNLLLTRELERACSRAGATLVLHHHDWWFDNRWQRWPEIRKSGIRTLAQVAQLIFSTTVKVRHVAINHEDAAVLQRHLPGRSAWLPNPASEPVRLTRKRVGRVREWLKRQANGAGSVWLMPCRLLRRKNVAEALLLTRWLKPDAFLLTTGGITSPEERPYAERLAAAARQHSWQLRLSVLQGQHGTPPAVDELIAASEAILLTSLQEGFGLPYLEAAAARRPLIARSQPNIAPDLARAGLRFPQSYNEILIAPELFDWSAERIRQVKLLQDWKRNLPVPYRPSAGTPVLLSAPAPKPIPFSRLTLSAQLEVLSQPPNISYAACAPFNPFLKSWSERAASGKLQVTPWPASAERFFSGKAFVARFQALLNATERRLSPRASLATERDFICRKLHSHNLYPLTWKPET